MRVDIETTTNHKLQEGCVIIIKHGSTDSVPYLVVSDRNYSAFRLVNLTNCEVLSDNDTSVEKLISFYFPNREYTVYTPDEVSMKVGVKNG